MSRGVTDGIRERDVLGEIVWWKMLPGVDSIDVFEKLSSAKKNEIHATGVGWKIFWQNIIRPIRERRGFRSMENVVSDRRKRVRHCRRNQPIKSSYYVISWIITFAARNTIVSILIT